MLIVTTELGHGSRSVLSDKIQQELRMRRYRKNKFIFFGLKQAYIGNYTLGVKLTSPSMPNMTTQYYFNLRIKDTTTYLPTTYPPNVTIVNHWRITA